MDTENVLLARCLERIEQVLNWGSSTQWTNHDFENLSEKVAEKTQVRLSVSTLKRIWGRVRYDSSPTPATLNALAQFLGYTGWRDFQAQEAVVVRAAAAVPSAPVAAPSGKRGPGWQAYGVIAFMAVLVLVVLALVKGKTPERAVAGSVAFQSRKVSDDLPNSVVFTYDIGGMAADSVFIQQSWDPTRRQRVPATGHTHTSLYYTPGYFQAKLIVDDSILKQDIVFIKTEGWRGIVDGKVPVYLTDAEMAQPGGMGIDAVTLHDKLASPVFTNRWVTFSNVRDFGHLRSDAFILEVSLRNTATVEQSLCRKVRIILLMKGDAMMIPLVAKGCISDIGMLTAQQWVDGKTNDLSAFGCDFTTFQRVRCIAAAGRLQIFVGDVLAWDEPVNSAPRDIVGLRLSFEGTGEIQHVKLSSPDTVWLDDKFMNPAVGIP